MTRTTIILLLAAAAFLALPAASAQQQGSLVLTSAPPTNALAADSTTLVPVKLEFTFDATGDLQTAGIPVSYAVTKAPNGTAVSVSPASTVIPTTVGADALGLSRTVEKTFQVVINVNKDAPADVFDTIEVTAITHPGTLGNAFMGRTVIPIHIENAQAPCAQATVTGPPPTTVPAPSASHASTSAPAAPVRVQSAAPASSFPVAPVAAVGGFGIVGAAVGLLARRRG